MLKAAVVFCLYSGDPPTGGSWPRSPVMITEVPPKGSSTAVPCRSRRSTHASWPWLTMDSSSNVLDAGEGTLQGFEALALKISPLPRRQSEEAVQRASGDEEARHTGWSRPSEEATEKAREGVNEV